MISTAVWNPSEPRDVHACSSWVSIAAVTCHHWPPSSHATPQETGYRGRPSCHRLQLQCRTTERCICRLEILLSDLVPHLRHRLGLLAQPLDQQLAERLLSPVWPPFPLPPLLSLGPLGVVERVDHRVKGGLHLQEGGGRGCLPLLVQEARLLVSHHCSVDRACRRGPVCLSGGASADDVRVRLLGEAVIGELHLLACRARLQAQHKVGVVQSHPRLRRRRAKPSPR
mmetsp:Transcript_27794/g.89210  ORF Transcript_27794/g.89210 Transcript_27794/m.89210 type:complete len:227 (-) Transcript_27794:112-792(-)